MQKHDTEPLNQSHVIHEEAVQLRARWLQKDADGVTLKDHTLAKLMEAKGSASLQPPDDRDLRGIKLVGQDLSGINLSECDLSYADLSRANLSKAKFVSAKLCSTTLFKAILDDGEFLKADLSAANLDECQAERAVFGSVNLSGASLFNANLQGALLSGADLKNADFRAANLQDAHIRQADMDGANFVRSNLQGADLAESKVAHAAMDYTDLQNATLRRVQEYKKATWISADIRNVNFGGAYLIRRYIMDQNYIYEFRNSSRLNGFLYHLWWLTSDCGRSLLRWFLWVVLIAVMFAFFYGWVELGFSNERTPLSTLYFSIVTLTTLGYGDVVPTSQAGQILVMIQVVIGYLALGGLLSILSSKMARRAN